MSKSPIGRNRFNALAPERLELRRVLASDWQNPTNPLDTDNSGFVAALDVLQIVNDINANGVRPLPATRPSNHAGPLCDTNGDGLLAALDALLVVNAINQYPDPLALSVHLDQASDGNGDEVVLRSNVLYSGSSNPNTNVKVERLEGDLASVALETTTTPTGEISVPLTLSTAINHFRFTVSDPRGRSIVTERIVRQGDVISAWNAALLEVVRETTSPSVDVPGLLIKPPPPLVARYLAMVHTAMFDAVNAVEQGFDSYLLDVGPQAGASGVAAAATAAHQVAISVYNTPDQIANWDRTLAEIMATVPEGNSKALGIALGQQAANVMLSARGNDGSSDSVVYTPGSEPGRWRPSEPAFASATLPQWPGVLPFAITSGAAFRPAAPPELNSDAYAQAVDQVRRLGSRNSLQRTDDETEIASFWADGGGTSTPPGHWNQIAIDIGLERDLPLIENARMMALLNLALADAGIASWDAKYAFDLWRPIDAIRLSDTDGNLATSADATWKPLLSTPSFPSYTSGHSTFSAAAAAVMTSLFGETFAFTTRADPGSTGLWPHSDDVAHLAVRSYSSFEAAADEAGLSRILGGIHYSFDNTAGLTAGRSVGQFVVGAMLKPK